MSDFEVLVYRIEEPVENHPDADRLSLIKVQGYTCISAKLEDGSHRYKQGELVAYIPEGAVLPEQMMKDMDFWDINKNKPAFKYVKAKKLRGIFSQGILFPLTNQSSEREDNLPEEGEIPLKYGNFDSGGIEVEGKYIDINHMDSSLIVGEGDDVAWALNIKKYEPVVPENMRGSITGEYINYTMKYDFDSIQKNPGLFDETDTVHVTEKLHGTLMCVGFIPELNDENLFGKDKNIFVSSKGIMKQGFVLKNLKDNSGNLYVNALNDLLSKGLEEKLKSIISVDQSIHLFFEVFGSGVQDLTYGQNNKTYRLFDIAFNKQYLDSAKFMEYAKLLELETVPILYHGPFLKDKMVELRDGLDTISNSHIREGIVIKDYFGGYHPKHGRKIAKFVSPDYLLRKNGTEFN
jgi:RNA ligase (TIGR02306 family)